jgi:nucleoside-diphosphate-sugar epimerase
MLSDRAQAGEAMTRVLVTGGSGFVGSHCVLRLLQQGYEVRTTVRSLDREKDVRAMLKEGAIDSADRLSFVAANLNLDTNWTEAAKGCDFVLHVASPFPPASPKTENEVIEPARDGALRVLRAARDAGVRRVVLTSSFAAIGYGHAPQTAPFDETSWTELRADLSAYVKSKTLAERAAWDFVTQEGGGLELSVVNPVGIFGPVLGPDYSTSINIIRRLMEGAIPGCPRLYFGVVDVRDVADLHLRAMTNPAAKGERFLAVAGECMSMFEVAKVLRRRMGAAAKRVRLELPDWFARILAFGSPTLREMVPQLGKIRNATSEKARRVLGWTPRPNEEVIVATAESLIRLGLLEGEKRHRGSTSQASTPTLSRVPQLTKELDHGQSHF